MSWSRSSQWSRAAEHDQRNEGSDGKRKHPGSHASEDYEMETGDRLRRTLAEAWRTTSSDEQRLGRRLDSEIKLFKLNDIDPNYKDNHLRIPDLSADIKIQFTTEEYNGAYVSHGQSTTVFFIRSSGRKAGRFDGSVLKISQEYDTEPHVAEQLPGLFPKLQFSRASGQTDMLYITAGFLSVAFRWIA